MRRHGGARSGPNPLVAWRLRGELTGSRLTALRVESDPIRPCGPSDRKWFPRRSPAGRVAARLAAAVYVTVRAEAVPRVPVRLRAREPAERSAQEARRCPEPELGQLSGGLHRGADDFRPRDRHVVAVRGRRRPPGRLGGLGDPRALRACRSGVGSGRRGLRSAARAGRRRLRRGWLGRGCLGRGRLGRGRLRCGRLGRRRLGSVGRRRLRHRSRVGGRRGRGLASRHGPAPLRAAAMGPGTGECAEDLGGPIFAHPRHIIAHESPKVDPAAEIPSRWSRTGRSLRENISPRNLKLAGLFDVLVTQEQTAASPARAVESVRVPRHMSRLTPSV